MTIIISLQNIQDSKINYIIGNIIITYDNYHFTITDNDVVTNIYEKIEPNVIFIENNIYWKYKESIIIPYYYNDLWMKIIYILNICGYNDFHIIQSTYYDKNMFIQNKQLFDKDKLLQVYMSNMFIKVIPNITIDDYDTTLPSSFKRSICCDIPLYDYLFSEKHSNVYEENCRYISNHDIKVISKTPEYMLSYIYEHIYSNLVDDTFLSRIRFDFVNTFHTLPINIKDYEELYKYYNFNLHVYTLLHNTHYDEVCGFIHFLLYENEKFLMNVPKGFNYETYITLNSDVKTFETPRDVIRHFILQGITEQRNIFILPPRFDWNMYIKLNNLQFSSKYESEYHYLTFGKKSGLLSMDLLPLTFDINMYSRSNNLLNVSNIEIIKHYFNHNNAINSSILDTFVAQDYISINPDLTILNEKSDEEVKKHFINYGIFENRLCAIQKVNFSKKILLMCHVGNVDVFKKIEQYINNAIDSNCDKYNFHVVINIINTLLEEDINYIVGKYSRNKCVEIKINRDFGFDIGSFFLYLKKCKQENITFDYIIKIHTKTSDEERNKLIKPILGSVNRIHCILELFEHETIGLVGSQNCMFYNHDKLAIHNFNHLSYLIKKYGLNISSQKIVQFIGGTVFWLRFSILQKYFFNHNFDCIINELNDENTFDWNWYICANKSLFSSLKMVTNCIDAKNHYESNKLHNNISGNLFHAIKYKTKSNKLRDAMIEHAYERLFSYMVEDSNYKQHFLPIESLVDKYNIIPVPIIFPQFHQIPENDKFWGEGFTEWTMLNKTPKNYLGNELQTPHNDIRQYNILDDTYIEWCEKTWKKFLISTVIYYHYWFDDNKKVMYKPIEKLRDENKPNINFCLSWATETWSNRFDGQHSNILIKQEYGNENSWKLHIDYLITFFKHKNYVKIDNKPIFMIYRPLDMPFETYEAMMKIFNEQTIIHGFNGVYIILYYNNCGNLNDYELFNKSKWTCAMMDFNPNYTNTKSFLSYQLHDETVPIFKDDTYDERTYLNYNIDVQNAVNAGKINNGYEHYKNISVSERKSRLYKSSLADICKCYDLIENEPRKHDNQLYSTMMGWDNSPRRDITKSNGIKVTIFLGESPYIFKQHIKRMVLKILKNPNNNINWLVLNAWNEWNEQTCLEPSLKYKYAFLDAIKSVFEEYY